MDNDQILNDLRNMLGAAARWECLREVFNRAIPLVAEPGEVDKNILKVVLSRVTQLEPEDERNITIFSLGACWQAAIANKLWETK